MAKPLSLVSLRNCMTHHSKACPWVYEKNKLAISIGAQDKCNMALNNSETTTVDHNPLSGAKQTIAFFVSIFTCMCRFMLYSGVTQTCDHAPSSLTWKFELLGMYSMLCEGAQNVCQR